MPKEILTKAGISVIDEDTNGYTAKIENLSRSILIPRELLTGFEALKAEWDHFEPMPDKGALVSRQSSEQALLSVGDFGLRRFIRPQGYKFGQADEKGACCIERCSDRFYWRVLIPN